MTPENKQDMVNLAPVRIATGAVLNNIDREKLSQDRRLTRFHHPLVQQQVGAEVALNVEIHNLIDATVSPNHTPTTVSNREQLIEHGKFTESILLENAKNPELLTFWIKNLIDTVLALKSEFEQGPHREKYDGHTIAYSALTTVLRERLAMPNNAQDMIIYPMASHDQFEANGDAMRVILGNIAKRVSGLDGAQVEIDAANAYLDEKFGPNMAV